MIVGLLVGGAGSNVALAVIAARDASFAVEQDYYQKALHWDDTMRQEAANAALGWSVAATLDRTAGPGQARVRALVSDRAGRPVRGARVALEAFHNARASRIFSAVLGPEPRGGYAATLPLDRPGLWELRLRVERDGEVFTRTVDLDLPRAP
jgi:nitrogen fixation protein FixH